jgi:hypothetical protein
MKPPVVPTYVGIAFGALPIEIPTRVGMTEEWKR